MKHHSISKTLVLCLAVFLGATWFLSANPSLTPPPGPITPSGRFGTRCDVLSLPSDADALHVISAPGSYYLSGNIAGQAMSHGIKITSDDVTLDLNGFQLLGVPNSLDGVNVPPFPYLKNVVIKNGGVHNWGESGLDLSIDVGRVERICSSENLGWGIASNTAAWSMHIVSCEVWRNGDTTNLSAGGGIGVGDHVLIRDCVAHDNRGDGIRCGSKCSILSSLATNNDQDGIQVNADCLIRGAVCTGNTATNYIGGAGTLQIDSL